LSYSRSLEELLKEEDVFDFQNATL